MYFIFKLNFHKLASVKLEFVEHLIDLVAGDEWQWVAVVGVLSNLDSHCEHRLLLGHLVEGDKVSIPGSKVFELELHLAH